MEWSQKYSVNVREIDQQHKKLFSIISKLELANIDKNDRKDLGIILQELVNYTSYHFSFEESLFAQYRYLERKEHVQLHSRIIERLKRFLIRFEHGEVELSEELLEFMRDWLSNHIQIEDMKYSSFFNELGIN